MVSIEYILSKKSLSVIFSNPIFRVIETWLYSFDIHSGIYDHSSTLPSSFIYKYFSEI